VANEQYRQAAYRKLEQLGYAFAGGDWHSPGGTTSATPTSGQADAMHAVLVQRADALEGCTESSEEEVELKTI
jgi:hypothetical protein